MSQLQWPVRLALAVSELWLVSAPRGAWSSMTPPDNESESDFPFEPGDRVLVRVRENGTTGNIVAKCEAECSDIRNKPYPSSEVAVFDLPWGVMNTVSLRPYEAEFEVVG